MSELQSRILVLLILIILIIPPIILISRHYNHNTNNVRERPNQETIQSPTYQKQILPSVRRSPRCIDFLKNHCRQAASLIYERGDGLIHSNNPSVIQYKNLDSFMSACAYNWAPGMVLDVQYEANRELQPKTGYPDSQLLEITRRLCGPLY